MGTMTHTYYVFSLSAPIALVVPMGVAMLWKLRGRLIPRAMGVVLLLGTGYVAIRIFEYSDGWGIWPVGAIVVTLLAAAGWLLAASRIQIRVTQVLIMLVLIWGPLATDTITLPSPHFGTNPLSGPVSNNPGTLSAHLDAARRGDPPLARQLGFGAEPSPQVTVMLRNAQESEWAAATYTAQNAAQYQLSSQRPVIALGGWLGTDPAPTLDQFKSLVSSKRIAYFIWQQTIVDGIPLGRDAAAITEWVQLNFKGENVDGVTIYDLRG